MKNRLVSLYSYIVFLVGMYGVWHLTIQSKKHGGYDLSNIPDLLDLLNNTITPKLEIQVQGTFSNDEIEQLNLTLTNQYSKFIVNVITEKKQSNGQLIRVCRYIITIEKGEQFSISIPTLKSINIVTQKLNNPQMLKNIKRYINKFYPLVNEETQMERRQLYTDRLLIFDFFFVNKSNSSTPIIQDVEQSIIKLAQHFELPTQNIKINYKNVNANFNFEDNRIELTKQMITKFTQKYAQVHSMNWKEYFQLDILALLSDPDVNVVVDSEENVSFAYIEPTNFLFHIYSKESLFKNVFQSFAVLLQIEEQLDIIFDGQEFHPSLSLLKQYFQEREFQRQVQHFIDELKYIQFLQSEGDYKITIESQQEFQKRVQFISDTLNYSKLRPSETANMLIDDRFSNLDTFSFEYTLGMYLPLILPFGYPIILSIYDELSSK